MYTSIGLYRHLKLPNQSIGNVLLGYERILLTSNIYFIPEGYTSIKIQIYVPASNSTHQYCHIHM